MYFGYDLATRDVHVNNLSSIRMQLYLVLAGGGPMTVLPSARARRAFSPALSGAAVACLSAAFPVAVLLPMGLLLLALEATCCTAGCVTAGTAAES